MPAFRPGPKGRLRPLKPVGSDLEDLARELGLEGALRLQRLRADWKEIFNQGPLALHTFPRYLSGSRLTMDVDSHAWLQQASFLKSEILKKLKPYGVSDLLMRIGRIEALREEHQPEVAPSELTREESDFLDEVLSGIDDADLEDHIRGAMQAWSRKRRAFRFRSRLADE